MTETTQENIELDTLPVMSDQDDKAKKEIARFTRKRSKKKKWIIFAIVIVLIVGGVKFLTPKPGPMPLENMSLQKQSLVNSVSLTGTVESAEASKVYPKATGIVKTLNVKVGDQVNAGDILCELDTEDLQLSIAQQQATINQTIKANEHTLSVSEKKLANAQNDVESGLDSQLVGAENSLKSAQQNLNDARQSYNDAKDDRTDADEDLTRAEKEYYNKKEAMEDAKKAYEDLPDGDPGKETAKTVYDTAEAAFQKADRELTQAMANSSELSRERLAYRSARVAYENALSNKNSAENARKQELEGYQDNIVANEINSDITSQQLALKKLQKQLGDSVIIAPISGTVTLSNAKIGEPLSAASAAFVVEDTDSLVIKTKVKEFDVVAVKEGMATSVKSDATGEETFEGKVSHIDPVAAKTADGSTQTSGSVEFPTDVELTSAGTGLRVGMNVRMNVVTAEKENVYAVPFDAVTMNAEGKQIVYIAKPDAEGKLLATEVPVTTGLETDFLIEISGDALADGDIILTSPMGIVPGSEVALIPGAGGAAGGGAGGGAAAMAVGMG